MNKLKCDICGGQIEMQPDKRGVCLHCGTFYSLATMKEMFSGVKVSVTGSDEDVAQWRKLVDRYYSSGDFPEAERIVKKILEAVPDDLWANNRYDELQVLKYMDVKNGVLERYTGHSEVLHIPDCVRKITCCIHSPVVYIPSSVEEICVAALCGCNNIFFAEGLTSINANIFGLSCFDGRDKTKTVNLPKSCCSFSVGGRVYKHAGITQSDLMQVNWAGGVAHWHIWEDDICINWKLELLTQEEFKKKQQKELLELMKKERENKWTASGLCRHCGGNFSGLFTSRCKKCGRTKDY